MQINCEDIAKKFRKETLFKGVNLQFSPSTYAILGPNSSGKSSFLKILAGALDSTQGVVSYIKDGIKLAPQNHYAQLSFCSPELELFEGFTVYELLQFHFTIKKAKLSIDQIMENAGLLRFRDKRYEELSSGLQQKVKLSLALFSDTEVLLLDEPCTNFDTENIKWYQSTIKAYCKHQLIVVASNQQAEYDFCATHIQITDYSI